MLRAVLERPVSVVIGALTLVVIGGFSLWRLPVSLLPALERPRLVIELRDGERSREELLRRIEPLERRLLALAEVREVHSLIADGEARIELLTAWQSDVDRLRIDAERRLAESLGRDIAERAVSVDTGDRRAILAIAVRGGSAHARTTFTDKVLLPELGRLPGVGRLRRLGGALRRPVVRPLAAALMARDLTAADLLTRLAEVGQGQPVGRLRDGARVRPLLVRESVRSLDELAALRLGDGTQTALGDVAEITLEEVPAESLARQDGVSVVLLELYRAPGANAVLLARAAHERLAELRQRAPAGLALEVVRDSSLEVVAALVQLGLAALLGLALGTVVLRWLLGSWRPTLALVVVVPASIIVAFGGFYLWDVSLDAVSLAGLALAAGMLVDNSIVVLEAIAAARARGDEDPVLSGTRQIAMPLLASFLTTAVVFLPLIYLRGLARAFFGVQAFAIVTSLAVSLLFSLSLTPVLARLGRRREASAEVGRSPGRELYLGLLARSLRRPWAVLAGVVALILAGGALLPSLPRQLIPAGDARRLAIELELPPETARQTAEDRLAELERTASDRLAATPAVASLAFYYGRDEPGGGSVGKEDDDEEAKGALELLFADAASLAGAERRLGSLALPGMRLAVVPRRGAVAAALDVENELLLEASAATPARAEALAARLGPELRELLGEDVGVAEERAGKRRRQAWRLGWQEARLAALESDGDALAFQVRAALGRVDAGRLEAESIEPQILVAATAPAELGLLPVRPRDRVVPLAAVASWERLLAPPALERRDGRPARGLRLVTERKLDLEQLAVDLGRLPLAADERVRLRGQAQELLRSFAQLRLALGLALILIFLTVAALYESLSLPLVVMLTVPASLAGALAALWLGGESLNLMSFLGMILLAGIVVNNAIVLIHRVEELRSQVRLDDALLRAAGERYRPILMTTLTTLLGMIPLALLGGEGLELRRALAVAVSGGLVSAFFATLLGVPILHLVLTRRSRRAEAS